MSQTASFKIQAKKLGVLVRMARQKHHAEIADCARVIGVSEEEFTGIEQGDWAVSLPQLEMLAYYLGIPVDYFLGNQVLHTEQHKPEQLDAKQVTGLRQRVIGVTVRKTRLQRGLSLEQLSEKCGLSKEQLERYEYGQEAIPLPELELIAEKLGHTARDFIDNNGPIGSWFVMQRCLENFRELGPELQVFVTKPVNRPYLELAQQLSEIDVQKLRMIAEGLLAITF